MDLSTIGNFLSNNSSTIGGLLGTGAQLYGQQNAGQAISSAANAGIGQANTTLGNINALYQPQTTLGNGAMSTLGSSLGINGQPANYNNFLNMPGYQFAVQQGTQAIQRQAASMGSAYTPNTAQAVGQYVTGTAMQDYNNYISQLQNASQFGATANQNLTQANLQTAGNIEQLGMNSGMAQAGLYTGAGQTVAGGANSSGSGGASTLSSGVNLAGKGLSYLSSLFGGGAPSTLSALGSSAAAATASELGSAAAPALAADTASALAPAIGAAPTAAELGTTASALAPISTAAPASSAAASGALGAGAGALAAAAIPAAFLGLGIWGSQQNTGYSQADIQNMEQAVRQNTTAPGQLSNSANYQTINDLVGLESENPEMFNSEGGVGPITQFLQSLGYSPIDWGSVPSAGSLGIQGSSGSVMGQGNTSGRQL